MGRQRMGGGGGGVGSCIWNDDKHAAVANYHFDKKKRSQITQCHALSKSMLSNLLFWFPTTSIRLHSFNLIHSFNLFVGPGWGLGFKKECFPKGLRLNITCNNTILNYYANIAFIISQFHQHIPPICHKYSMINDMHCNVPFER